MSAEAAEQPLATRETALRESGSHEPRGETDDLAGLRGLVNGLENLIRIPGTNLGIGLDAVLGFVLPGVGDALTGAASLGVLFRALKRGVPKVILLRMLLNIGIDVVGGLIPGVGDVFDVFWRANVKNLELLEEYEAERPRAAPAGAARSASAAAEAIQPRKPSFGDHVIVFGAIALVCVSIAAPFVLIGWLIGAM